MILLALVACVLHHFLMRFIAMRVNIRVSWVYGLTTILPIAFNMLLSTFMTMTDIATVSIMIFPLLTLIAAAVGSVDLTVMGIGYDPSPKFYKRFCNLDDRNTTKQEAMQMNICPQSLAYQRELFRTQQMQPFETNIMPNQVVHMGQPYELLGTQVVDPGVLGAQVVDTGQPAEIYQAQAPMEQPVPMMKRLPSSNTLTQQGRNMMNRIPSLRRTQSSPDVNTQQVLRPRFPQLRNAVNTAGNVLSSAASTTGNVLRSAANTTGDVLLAT